MIDNLAIEFNLHVTHLLPLYRQMVAGTLLFGSSFATCSDMAMPIPETLGLMLPLAAAEIVLPYALKHCTVPALTHHPNRGPADWQAAHPLCPVALHCKQILVSYSCQMLLLHSHLAQHFL